MTPDIAATDLVDQSGISYRQLDHWTRRGYLRPLNADPGCGRERFYTRAEFVVAQRISGLIEAGLTVPAAAAIARGDTTLLAALLRTLAHIIDGARDAPTEPKEGQ